MTVFWLAVVALLLAGVGLFLPLLLGGAGARNAERRRLNLMIHQQRRKELAADSLNEVPDAQLAVELDRDLLTDLDASTPPALQSPSAGRAGLAVGLVAASMLGIGTYLYLGRPDLIGAPPATAEKTPSADDVAAGIQQLAEHLAENPDDLEGWTLLARSLLATGQPDRAATAFEFAIKLAPDDLSLKGSLAQALAETQKGSFHGRPAAIVDEILQRDPSHPIGLWLAGLAAAEQRDVVKALGYWQKLKRLLPEDSEDRRAIDQYVTKVQGLASPSSKDGKPATAKSSGASIRVTVTLADALKSRAAPDDAVFIFARAASGPPMPLAVVRRQVRDLPAEVTLDDSLAMMPERTLSSFEQIVIGARVSRSGRPMPASGDLQGLSQPIPSQSTRSQTIEIREIVP